MKKKIAKKKKPVKQKIDIVLESLLNLERKTKELISRVGQLERIVYNIYNPKPPKDENKYWPNVPRYDGVTWEHTKPVIGIDDHNQPIYINSWDDKITRSICNNG